MRVIEKEILCYVCWNNVMIWVGGWCVGGLVIVKLFNRYEMDVIVCF